MICKTDGKNSFLLDGQKQDDGTWRFYPVVTVVREGFTRDQRGDRIYNPPYGVSIPEEVLPQFIEFVKTLDLKDLSTWKKQVISNKSRL